MTRKIKWVSPLQEAIDQITKPVRDLRKQCRNISDGVHLMLGHKKVYIDDDSEEEVEEIEVPAKIAKKYIWANPEKKQRTRHNIPVADAAKVCKVEKRTMERWLAGQNTPPGFPGLSDSGVFLAWAETYKGRKAIFSGKHKSGNTRKNKGRQDAMMADQETDI